MDCAWLTWAVFNVAATIAAATSGPDQTLVVVLFIFLLCKKEMSQMLGLVKDLFSCDHFNCWNSLSRTCSSCVNHWFRFRISSFSFVFFNIYEATIWATFYVPVRNLLVSPVPAYGPTDCFLTDFSIQTHTTAKRNTKSKTHRVVYVLLGDLSHVITLN